MGSAGGAREAAPGPPGVTSQHREVTNQTTAAEPHCRLRSRAWHELVDRQTKAEGWMTDREMKAGDGPTGLARAEVSDSD